jgi:hypothetical protein
MQAELAFCIGRAAKDVRRNACNVLRIRQRDGFGKKGIVIADGHGCGSEFYPLALRADKSPVLAA